MTRRWRPGRRARRTLTGVGVVILAIAATLGFLLGTTAGARFVVRQAVGRVPLPLTVAVARIDGRLLGPLTLRGVAVANPLVEVAIDSVEVDWSPRSLLTRRLLIERVVVEGVDARLLPPPPRDPAAPPAAPQPPPQLPLEIVIAEARATRVKFLLNETVELRDLRLSLQGRPDRYELDIATELVAAGAPSVGLAATATGTLADVTVAPLEVRALGGVLQARCGAAWYPEITWTVDATVDGVQPGQLLPEPDRLPGALAARLRSEGRVDGGVPSGWATLDTLTGDLLALPVTGAARVEWQGVTTARASARLGWGSARADVAAAIDDSVAADLAVVCPDVAGLASDLAGRVELTAHVVGPLRAPRASAALRVDDLVRAEPPLRIARLAGELDLALADLDTTPTGEGRLRVRADSLAFGQVALDSAVVTATGTDRRQRARLVAGGEPLHAHLALGGALDPAARTWAGEVDTLVIANPYAGTWTLRAPAALRAGQTAGALEDLCLVQAAASLCLGAGWDGGAWRANGELADLPLAMADPHLAADQHLRGTAGATFAATGDAAALSGEARVALTDARYVFLAAGKPDSLVIESAQATAAAGPSDVTASLAAVVVNPRSEGRAEFAASVTLPGGARLPLAPTTQPVAATIEGHVPDLALIDGLSPLVADSRGRVDLAARVAGTLLAPVVTGELRVEDLGLTLPDLGITLADGTLTASGDVAEGYALDGSVRSGAGTLTLSGRVPPRLTAATPLSVTVRGEAFEAMDTPQIQVAVTPDLELVSDGQRLDVRGTVDLPVVDVELIEMPELAVAPSRDAVVVDRAPPSAPPPIDTWVDVTVTLGEAVRFRGFAMAISLTGGLAIQQHVPDLPTCRGDIRILDGYYRAYGQNLDVERGVVSFVGPVENPALDIKARRAAPDGVVAGVIITGSALAPQLRVYSDPPLPQTQAIAYLVTGRPLDDGSGDDKARVASTAALLGSNVLSSQIGSRIGLDEARVETGGSLDEAALVTGKYLTPKLYLSYAMGLFDRSNLMRLRYILTPNWAVQTETGTAMGADLFYKIERGGD